MVDSATMRYYIVAVLLIVLLPLAARPAAADAPPLTLDDVFPPRDLSALGLDESRLRVLVATGDVIPARSVDMRIRGRGNDFFYPLAKTADLLHSGDLTVVNLEAPLIRNCPPHDEGMQFCGQPGFAAALKNEKAHKQFLADALGSKTPTGLRFRIPPKAVRTGQSLLNTGVALETAFVAAYLGASNTLSSPDLRLVAARVAANEASHFSFFDAAAGGHGVLPALPKTDTIPNTVKKLQPFLA